MRKWEIQFKGKDIAGLSSDAIIDILLKNRGIETKEEKHTFLQPQLTDVTMDSVTIDKKHLQKALSRIQQAIEKKEQIVIFGDYDVDGICGSAILWETLHNIGAKALPYIPHRIDEGYGLSKKGIENITTQIKDIKLIVTVDNGIVAVDAVDFANKQGIDVIITDHHVKGEKAPKAHALVHTTKLCGTGVAYLLSQELKTLYTGKSYDPVKDTHNHLELVALATIADLVPLTGANRTFTKYGLEMICNTKRLGLLELFKEAALDGTNITSYHVGHIIAPRLNAMGRLEYAMDSLRLLCTTNPKRALDLAMQLGTTNKQRQQITIETVQHALAGYEGMEGAMKKLLFVADASYQPGVIGLVAGKLVETYYRPAIVLSIGEEYSKASARSIAGFNIIDFIRSASHLLVDAGGHPMAAGFTVETAKLPLLQETLEQKIEEALSDDLLTRTLRVDMELPVAAVSATLHQDLSKLAPFGMGNPEPVFVSHDVIIDDVRIIGKEGKHLKLRLHGENLSTTLEAVAFGMGQRVKELKIGNKISIVYTIDINEWNGMKKLQLKIKDINPNK